MKTIACILLLITCFYGGIPQISVPDAEKILGQRVRLTKNAKESTGAITKMRMTFTGITDTTGHLYTLSAKYAGAAEARKAYAAIMAGNAGMPGEEKLTGLGNEAFFHTDKQHFDLLIFRKNDQLVTLKVNRISSRVSLIELRRLANKLEQVL